MALTQMQLISEEMQIETQLNAPLSGAREFMADANAAGKLSLSLCNLIRPTRSSSDRKAVRVASHGNCEVRELENGAIEVDRDDHLVPSAKPELRRLAAALNLSILNGNGNPYNSRQLGSVVIQAMGAGV